MPNQSKTPVRGVRLPDTIWEALLREAAEKKTTPSNLIREILRWHVRCMPTINETAVLTCPKCKRPVESWTHKPDYILDQDYEPLWEGGPLVGIPGTDKHVRVVGAYGPEWTLKPCGDQFYKLAFEAVGDTFTKIISLDNQATPNRL